MDEMRCDTGSCVEVELGDPVVVWQTDRPELKVPIPGWQWQQLLGRVCSGEHINWDGALFPLVFSKEEIDAFVARVKAGKFRVHDPAGESAAGLPAVPEEKRPEDETWLCGAFQPAAPPLKPYRCTDPAGHIGDHVAEIDGEIFAFWSAGESKENT